MQLNRKLLEELQNRLKVGNRRGVHLNAIPGRSRFKFDVHQLSHVNDNLPFEFIESLLSEKILKFKISMRSNSSLAKNLFNEDEAQLVKISKLFENLINETEAIEAEKGINTFGFGYPLLVRKDKSDNKLTVSPILIWSLKIRRTKEFNTWLIERKEDDPIYINEVLINHLMADSKIVVSPISSEMLDDGLIDKKELIDICLNLSKSINGSLEDDAKEVFSNSINNLKAIPKKEYFEKLIKSSSNSIIEFGGLFSIFEVQKQNIIKDYEDLLEQNSPELDLSDFNNEFQTLSSVETDPSQQSILNSMKLVRNISIQGPPGTGKSQSLTAVMINALENHKRTIVVCEKRTALEVLEKALNERGLGDNCILIKDIIRDRRKVVDSVRARTDSQSYKRTIYSSSKTNLTNLLEKSVQFIKSINSKHIKLGEKIYNEKTWPQTVGTLLRKKRISNVFGDIDYPKENFEFTDNELSELTTLVETAEELYTEFKSNNVPSFLNSKKLVGDNPFLLKQTIEENIESYISEFKGETSIINKIRKEHKDNNELFDLKRTERLSYKLISLFSKEKRATLRAQRELLMSCKQLVNRINSDGWYKVQVKNKVSSEIISEIENLIEIIDDYFNSSSNNFTSEFNWFKFYNNLNGKKQELVNCLKDKKDWSSTIFIYYLDSLLLNSATTELPLNDNELNSFGRSLSGIGKEQIEYIKRYWHSVQMNLTKRFNESNNNINVENLYNKKKSKKHKRLSLRQIVKFDRDLFTSFFPIILTTPDVCSNLFKGMNKYFDIVLFDEASQLRLEDNLPSLLKGNQIIIAGDEHQMPPSNYFSKIFDNPTDENEDNDDIDDIKKEDFLLSCESLLDFGDQMGFEKRYLDFHYRSQHPYLIDFSNNAFYNNRLKPLPYKNDYTPINYIQVNGTYSDQSNESEAEAVLDILENNIHRLSDGRYPSVGIATFNITQRNLIKSKISERQKFEKYSDFNEKIIKLEEEGLFVKNLENIQGDERDVIILSTTYGINKDGDFSQRFGPINQKKGYKLLNVIITRAKYKIYVCSSIPEEVFLNYKEHLITEGGNNRRAVFFAYLSYAKAVSDGNIELKDSILKTLIENSGESKSIDSFNSELDSPFEEEVYHRLTKHFNEEQLHPQLKFGGFRIDIVFDADIKGVPPIAIECDGALYHQSEEAYLYDYNRQKILEKHGFVFHRIWSTNWWQNPNGETENLIKFINKITDQKSGFKNDIDVSKNIGLDSVLTRPERFTLEKENPIISEPKIKVKLVPKELFSSAQITVKKDSAVSVKYVNNNKDLIVKLADNKKQGAENGMQYIYNKSPLALSLIGKKIGDTCKVGELDNYVKILEIRE